MVTINTITDNQINNYKKLKKLKLSFSRLFLEMRETPPCNASPLLRDLVL